jgi:hypothetical protein
VRAAGGGGDGGGGADQSAGGTLDEIYKQVIGQSGGGDGRTVITASTSQVTIGQPGSYVLAGSISATGTGISITASDVTLDLNGYRVSTSSTMASAILLGSGSLGNITIRNGTLSGGQNGVTATTSTGLNGLLLEDLRVVNAKQNGIFLNSTNHRGIQVRRCHIIDTGSTTTVADGNLVIAGIALGGGAHRVEDCTVSRLFYNGSGTPTFRGIQVSTTNTLVTNLIAGCCVAHDAPITGIGMSFSIGIYRNNSVMQFSSPYAVSGSINGGGNF